MEHEFKSILTENQTYLDALQRSSIPVLQLGFEELKYKCGHKLSKSSPKPIIPIAEQVEFLDRLDHTMKFLHYEMQDTKKEQRRASYLSPKGVGVGVTIDFAQMFPKKQKKLKKLNDELVRPESPNCARPTNRMIQIEEEAKRLHDEKEKEEKHRQKIVQEYDIVEDGVKIVYNYHGVKVPVEKLQKYERPQAPPPEIPKMFHDKNIVFTGAIIEKTSKYVENIRKLAELAKPKAKQTRPTSATPQKVMVVDFPQPTVTLWPEFKLMEEDDVMITIEYGQESQYSMAANDIQVQLTDVLKQYAMRYYCLFKITSTHNNNNPPSGGGAKQRPASAGMNKSKSVNDIPVSNDPNVLFEIQIALRNKQSAMVHLLHSKKFNKKWPILSVLILQVKKLLREGQFLFTNGTEDPHAYSDVGLLGVKKNISIVNTADRASIQLPYELYPIFDYRKHAIPVAAMNTAPVPVSIAPVSSQPVSTPNQMLPGPSAHSMNNTNVVASPAQVVSVPVSIQAAPAQPVPMKVLAVEGSPSPVLVTEPVLAPTPTPTPVPTVISVVPSMVPIPQPEPGTTNTPAVVLPTTVTHDLPEPISEQPSRHTIDEGAGGDSLALAYQNLLEDSSDFEEKDGTKKVILDPSLSVVQGGQESQAFGEISTDETKIVLPSEPISTTSERILTQSEQATSASVPVVPVPVVSPPTATTTKTTKKAAVAAQEEENYDEENYEEENYEEENYDEDVYDVDLEDSPQKPLPSSTVTNKSMNRNTIPEHEVYEETASTSTERRTSQLIQLEEAKKAVLDIKNMLDDDELEPGLPTNTMDHEDDEFWDKFDRNLGGSFYDSSTSPSKEK